MQKVINGIALFSGVVSLGLVVGGVWVYLEKDNLINGVKTQMINGVTSSIQEMLPGMLDAAMPEIPEVPTSTGGVSGGVSGVSGFDGGIGF